MYEEQNFQRVQRKVPKSPRKLKNTVRASYDQMRFHQESTPQKPWEQTAR